MASRKNISNLEIQIVLTNSTPGKTQTDSDIPVSLSLNAGID